MKIYDDPLSLISHFVVFSVTSLPALNGLRLSKCEVVNESRQSLLNEPFVDFFLTDFSPATLASLYTRATPGGLPACNICSSFCSLTGILFSPDDCLADSHIAFSLCSYFTFWVWSKHIPLYDHLICPYPLLMYLTPPDFSSFPNTCYLLIHCIPF